MIGLICAIPEEFAALRQGLHLTEGPIRRGSAVFWRGVRGGEPLVLVESGIGKVNAAVAAALLLDRFEAKTLIFAGVAGGLAADLHLGDMLLADRIGVHDFGLMAGETFTPTASGLIPLGQPRLEELPAVAAPVRTNLEALRVALTARGEVTCRLGGLITGDYFLNCSLTRDSLREAFGADAIDMESGAVDQVARAWNTPLYVIRTLSDRAGDESHATYPEMAAMAARNAWLGVAGLLDILATRD